MENNAQLHAQYVLFDSLALGSGILYITYLNAWKVKFLGKLFLGNSNNRMTVRDKPFGAAEMYLIFPFTK